MVNDWENPQIQVRNREPAHAPLIPYANVKEAVKRIDFSIRTFGAGTSSPSKVDDWMAKNKVRVYLEIGKVSIHFIAENSMPGLIQYLDEILISSDGFTQSNA